MKRITTITGKCIPLLMDNVDTDLIIPAQYLTSLGKQGYGKHLFQRLREQNENFVFNLERYRNANILIAGENFGCGSSREHAVWALMEAGIEAVIATSFADIFFNNASKNGLLLIQLSSDKMDRLFRSDENCMINLESQVIRVNHQEEGFEISPFIKHCFVEGVDELEYLLSHESAIREHREKFRQSERSEQ